MNSKKIVLLNGSPRKKGTSYSFARTMKKLLEERGNTVEILHIIDYVELGKSFEELKNLLVECNIIGLYSPLYVDSLPYPVIHFFEKLQSEYKDVLKGKGFFAVGQCAFPYPNLIETLIRCCRCFAEATGMKWLGGLKYGGGVIINGGYLEGLGKKGKKITAAFSAALEDILQEKIISTKVQSNLSKDFPRIFSKPAALLLNKMVKANARKNGFTIANMEKKAYLKQ